MPERLTDEQRQQAVAAGWRVDTSRAFPFGAARSWIHVDHRERLSEAELVARLTPGKDGAR